MSFNKSCRHHRQLKELIIRESPWESKEMVLAVSKRILERQKSSNDFHNNSWSITIILLVAQNFKIHVVKLRTYLKSRRYYTASEKFQLLYPYYTVSNGRIRITNLWNLALFTPLTLFFFMYIGLEQSFWFQFQIVNYFIRILNRQCICPLCAIDCPYHSLAAAHSKHQYKKKKERKTQNISGNSTNRASKYKNKKIIIRKKNFFFLKITMNPKEVHKFIK